MAAGGMNRQQVADYFGITVRRLNQIFKEREDLLSAFNTGIAEGIKTATDALMDKIRSGDTVPILFYLKCRAGWVEQQYIKEKPDMDNIPRVNVYLPSNNRDVQLIESDSNQ